ncbi:MAG: hypothetical protein CME06_02155 [Gemmatimonadetes bacterium]|nr:hypothetical protein [Gemmatimonadota bacterium]
MVPSIAAGGGRDGADAFRQFPCLGRAVPLEIRSDLFNIAESTRYRFHAIPRIHAWRNERGHDLRQGQPIFGKDDDAHIILGVSKAVKTVSDEHALEVGQ